MKTTANAAKKAVGTLALMLALTSVSAAWQASIPATPVTKVPELAKATTRWMLVSIPDRKLALLEDGKVIRIYRIAVGKKSTPSPTGSFTVVNRVTNPRYYHKGQIVEAGKGNPVGNRWMGLSVKGYGIHGTNQPNSIGKAVSSGCIRMGQRDLDELFEMVAVGDAVEIRAQRDEQVAQIFAEGEAAQTIAEVRTDAANGIGQ